MATLWDERLTSLKVKISRLASPPPPPKPHWAIIAAWLTINGSWESAPTWALRWRNDNLGGDHHIYGLAVNRDGEPFPEAGFILAWPGGHDLAVGHPEWGGWANLPLGPSGYDWRKTSGPYTWRKVGDSDILEGLGLPYPPLPWESGKNFKGWGSYTGRITPEGGCHVSFFVVFEKRIASKISNWKPYDLKVFGITLPVQLRERTEP